MADRDRTLARLTPRMLAQSRVLAKGNRILDVQRLVRTYGGKASQWVKKSSPVLRLVGTPMSIIGMNTLASDAWK